MSSLSNGRTTRVECFNTIASSCFVFRYVGFVFLPTYLRNNRSKYLRLLYINAHYTRIFIFIFRKSWIRVCDGFFVVTIRHIQKMHVSADLLGDLGLLIYWQYIQWCTEERVAGIHDEIVNRDPLALSIENYSRNGFQSAHTKQHTWLSSIHVYLSWCLSYQNIANLNKYYKYRIVSCALEYIR